MKGKNIMYRKVTIDGELICIVDQLSTDDPQWFKIYNEAGISTDLIPDSDCGLYVYIPVVQVNHLPKYLFNNAATKLPTINVKLVTKDRIGSTYVDPISIDHEDDGSITVVVEAWRE